MVNGSYYNDNINIYLNWGVSLERHRDSSNSLSILEPEQVYDFKKSYEIKWNLIEIFPNIR